MEKEFVPYELAVKLKAFGFDEPCFGYYDNQIKKLDTISSEVCERLCKHDTHTKAPTFSQIFRWFREEYGLWSTLSYDEDDSGKMLWGINAFEYGIGPLFFLEEYDTYEEAELACLQELIEIIESKKED